MSSRWKLLPVCQVREGRGGDGESRAWEIGTD